MDRCTCDEAAPGIRCGGAERHERGDRLVAAFDGLGPRQALGVMLTPGGDALRPRAETAENDAQGWLVEGRDTEGDDACVLVAQAEDDVAEPQEGDLAEPGQSAEQATGGTGGAAGQEDAGDDAADIPELPGDPGYPPQKRDPPDQTVPDWPCGVPPGETTDPGSPSWLLVGDSVLTVLDAAYLDNQVMGYMNRFQIPNGSFAVIAPDGRLVHARGFTNRAAFTAAGESVFVATPNSRFRIASLSKTLTAIAILQADEAGLLPLGLDTRVADLVDLRTPPPTPYVVYSRDSRLDDIRVVDLLLHMGGWLESVPAQDPNNPTWVAGVYPGYRWAAASSLYVTSPYITSRNGLIAASFGASLPVTFDQTLRYGNIIPLTWAPGAYYSYSNYGYWLLGRVIEAVACRSYESWVHRHIWDRLGARDSIMGHTLRSMRAVDEAPSYGSLWPGASGASVTSVMQSSPYEADPMDYSPYADFDVRLYDAHGGWLSSAFDLARLLRDVFVGPSGLLGAAGMDQMMNLQTRIDATSTATWSPGWLHGSSVFWGGGIVGSKSRIGCLTGGSGASYVFLFNRFWGSMDLPSSTSPTFFTTMVNAVTGRLNRITDWNPPSDLFNP